MHIFLNKKISSTQAQAALEFAFCFMVLLILVYSCVTVFRWSGKSLAVGRISHDESLTTNIKENWSSVNDGPLKQLSPNFYKFLTMDDKTLGGSAYKATGSFDPCSGADTFCPSLTLSQCDQENSDTGCCSVSGGTCAAN